jgi:PKD repeat protein
MKGRNEIKKLRILFILIIIILPFTTQLTFAQDQVTLSFYPFSNDPPYAPINPDPPNGSINITIPVTLYVDVYDETGFNIDVYFYNALDDTLIGVDYNIPCGGSTASVVWNETIDGEIYHWYAIAKDSQFENKSETWIFATGPNQPPIISNEYPLNNSTQIDIQPLCHVDVFDIDEDRLTIYWYENSTGSWILRRIEYNVTANSTIYWSFIEANLYFTTYYWMVIVTDSIHYINAIFNFTTKSKPSTPRPPSGGYTPPPNQLPLAIITAPEIAYVNETIVFYAYYSYDVDGYLTGYRWDFENDGVYDTNWTEDTYIICKYSKSGNYTLILQVQDNYGSISTTSHNINIIEIKSNMKPPIPITNGPYFAYINETIEFKSDKSYDPDGIIINYTWNFGDGNISYLKNPIHTFTKPGNYILILKIIDNDNLSNVTITNALIIDKEEISKEKERELPFLLIFIILLTIIITIILFIIHSKRYQLTLVIDKTNDSKEIKNKDKNIDKEIDKLLSEFDKNSNKK